MLKTIGTVALLCASLQLFSQNPIMPNNNKESAKPKVWWFHGACEETTKGIDDDLKSFADAGIGGVVYYDQVHEVYGNPSSVFSQDWWNKLKYSAREAQRLGLTFEMNISNGYVAGGPWIDAEHAMQHIITSDTIVESDGNAHVTFPPQGPHYHDIAVIAIPHQGYKSWNVRINGNPIILPTVSDVIDTKCHDKPIRSITVYGKGRLKSPTSAMNIPCDYESKDIVAANFQPLPPIGELQCSDDGTTFRKVCDIPPIYNDMGWKLNQITISVSPTKARFFRLYLHDWNLRSDDTSPLTVTEFKISQEPMTDRWEEKTANRSNFISYSSADTDTSYFPTIDSIKVLPVFSDANGNLCCRIPKGRWNIMRFGYCPTGAKIKHGRKGMTGMECDRLSADAARLQYENYFKRIADTLKAQGTPLTGAVSDSHEAGTQNWTRGFKDVFDEQNGFSIIPWLPALTGHIIESREKTEAVLYDYRHTLSRMVASNFFGTIDSLCHRDGYTFTAQALGNGMCFPADNISVKRYVDKPQGEFWTYQTRGSYDIKEAASAAHVYGKPIASAESFTDCGYSTTLTELKSLADFAFCMGINEFVVCASPYQPRKLKVPLDISSNHPYALNRNNPIWKSSKWFWKYLEQTALLMRQGRPVNDICVYLGDEIPMKQLSYRLPRIPDGYCWDVCTGDAFSTDGSSFSDNPSDYCSLFRVVVVEDGAMVPVTALRHLVHLTKKGIAVVADRNSIERVAAHYGMNDNEYEATLDSLFSSHMTCSNISAALDSMELRPDIEGLTSTHYDGKVYFAHRRTSSDDLYILYNKDKAYFSREITLRAKGTVELYNLMTRRREHYPSENFTLRLAPEETVILRVRKR